MRITTGRGRNAKTVEIGTGYLFRRRDKEDRRSLVEGFCALAGIPC